MKFEDLPSAKRRSRLSSVLVEQGVADKTVKVASQTVLSVANFSFSHNSSFSSQVSLASQPNNRDDDENEDERLLFPAFLPRALYCKALCELSQGGAVTIQKCLATWRAGRLSLDMLESIVHSIAWQSPSLSRQLKSRQQPVESECELLSADDLEDMKNRPAFLDTPPISPTLRPSLPHLQWMRVRSMELRHEGSLEEDEILKALALVSNTRQLDSTRTTLLTALVRRHPKLSAFFENNGWDASSSIFLFPPDWARAAEKLAAGASFAPSRNRKRLRP